MAWIILFPQIMTYCPRAIRRIEANEDLLGAGSSARDLTLLGAGNWEKTPLKVGR